MMIFKVVGILVVTFYLLVGIQLLSGDYVETLLGAMVIILASVYLWIILIRKIQIRSRVKFIDPCGKGKRITVMYMSEAIVNHKFNNQHVLFLSKHDVIADILDCPSTSLTREPIGVRYEASH